MTRFVAGQRIVVGQIPGYPELAGLTGVVTDLGAQGEGGWRGPGGWVRLEHPPAEMVASTASSTRPNCMFLYAAECEPAEGQPT